MTITGVEATAEGAAGARVGRGLTTLYVRAKLDSRAKAWLPGDAAAGARPVDRRRDDGDHERRATACARSRFRTAKRGPRPGQVTEWVGRLDLRDPANRAVAEPLLARRLPWPPGVLSDLRAVALRTAQVGTVERAVYAVRDESEDFEWPPARHLVRRRPDKVDVEKRLVAASAWTPGSQERVREDCLM